MEDSSYNEPLRKIDSDFKYNSITGKFGLLRFGLKRVNRTAKDK